MAIVAMNDSKDDGEKRGRTPNTCCSRYCLCWPWPYIHTGYSRSLAQENMRFLKKSENSKISL